MSLEIVQISIPNLMATQNFWMPYIVEIAKKQGCFVEQRLADIFSGNLRLAMLFDTEKKECFGLVGYKYLQEGPNVRGMIETAVGNDHKRLRSMYHRVEDELFRNQGCIGVSVWARPGWSPDLRRWGYRLKHVQYQKDFADAKHDQHGRFEREPELVDQEPVGSEHSV